MLNGVLCHEEGCPFEHHDYPKNDYFLVDDGTIDTVIGVHAGNRSFELRYDLEFAAEYRDEDGVLDFDAFVEDVVMYDAEEELCAQ
jgi:hypothetical protein